MFKKLFILAGLILICSLGWYFLYPREQEAGLSAHPSRADADAFSRKMEKLAAGESVGQILGAHPQLTEASIRAALAFAARALRADVVYPLDPLPT